MVRSVENKIRNHFNQYLVETERVRKHLPLDVYIYQPISDCVYVVTVRKRNASKMLKIKNDSKTCRPQLLKHCKIRLIKTTDRVCTWLSVINTKYTYVMKHFNASKP